jgi:hypothetical protein
MPGRSCAVDDKLNTERIKQLLNRSLDDLDRSTLVRLHDAHVKVMNHLQSRSKRMEFHACLGESATLHFAGLRHRTFRRTGIFLLAATILIGVAYWQQTAGDDNNDADISILTGELPIQYYED